MRGPDTYARLLRHYVEQGVIRPTDRVLVQFAGVKDERICDAVGLTNCTFTNVAPGSASTGATAAQRFDAHRMPHADLTFDHAIAHDGLHHCSRPHEALHEMYRLARKTILFVENQDSLLMRLGARTGAVGLYEFAAVADGGHTTGGVDGTGVPNYVYRWTRREVRKTVAAFDPGRAVPIEFTEEWNLGDNRAASRVLADRLGLNPRTANRLMSFAHRGLNAIAARQGNIFAAAIRKDRSAPQPWMAAEHPSRQV